MVTMTKSQYALIFICNFYFAENIFITIFSKAALKNWEKILCRLLNLLNFLQKSVISHTSFIQVHKIISFICFIYQDLATLFNVNNEANKLMCMYGEWQPQRLWLFGRRLFQINSDDFKSMLSKKHFMYSFLARPDNLLAWLVTKNHCSYAEPLNDKRWNKKQRQALINGSFTKQIYLKFKLTRFLYSKIIN